jgi:uncharacterized lipoprotein YbaY
MKLRYVLLLTAPVFVALLAVACVPVPAETPAAPAGGSPATAAPAAAYSGVLTGTVTYRVRSALPEDAVVKVSLVDVSRADAPATVLAQQEIVTGAQQVPIPFELKYDPAAIDERYTYAVQARIEIGGQLAFISTTVNQVLTRGNPATGIEVLVQPVPPAQAAPTVTAAPAAAYSGVMTGTVTYRVRSALPEDAVVRVTLEDVSRADAPATVLAQQEIVTGGKQVPIPFELKYDPAGIEERSTYAVRARIEIGGKLAFTSTTVNQVLTRGNPATGVEVLVEPVR